MTSSPSSKTNLYQHILLPTFIMIVFTSVMTGIIAGLDAFTAPQIQKNEAIKIQNTVLYVLHLHPETLSEKEKSAIFDQRIKPITLNGSHAYLYHEGNQILGVVFPMSGKGLWGTINGYFGLDMSGGTLLGVDFTSHSETPGLGGRIDELWFKEQFRQLPIKHDVPTAQYKSAGAGNVDAITGATLTSNDVLKMINEAISSHLADLKEVHL